MSTLATQSVNIEEFSPTLALEIAAELLPVEEIFKAHGLSDTQGLALLENPVFKDMVAAARTEWASSGNVKERIRSKARLALEELLPDHFAMATDKNINPANRNEAVKIIKDLAGMAPKAVEGEATASRFIVNINLDDASKDVSITAPIAGELDD